MSLLCNLFPLLDQSEHSLPKWSSSSLCNCPEKSSQGSFIPVSQTLNPSCIPPGLRLSVPKSWLPNYFSPFNSPCTPFIFVSAPRVFLRQRDKLPAFSLLTPIAPTEDGEEIRILWGNALTQLLHPLLCPPCSLSHCRANLGLILPEHTITCLLLPLPLLFQLLGLSCFLSQFPATPTHVISTFHVQTPLPMKNSFVSLIRCHSAFLPLRSPHTVNSYKEAISLFVLRQGLMYVGWP